MSTDAWIRLIALAGVIGLPFVLTGIAFIFWVVMGGLRPKEK